MKHLLLVALVTTSFSGFANANNGVYASVKAGVSDTKMKDNEVHYSTSGNPNILSDGIENYYQNNQSKSIYPNISVAIGFDFSQISNINTRTELEYTYKDSATFKPTTNYWSSTNISSSSVYSGDNSEKFSNRLESQSLMFNGYYDFKNISKLTPYISAGFGVTRIKNNYTNLRFPKFTLSQADHQFTWSVGVGAAYNITNNVALDLNYKYMNAGKFKFNEDFGDHENESIQFKLSSQDYSLGIRYNF